MKMSGGRRAAAFLLVALSLLFIPFSVGAGDKPFAIIGDTHIGANNTVYPVFIRAIEDQKIELIIHVGDAINSPGSSSQWARFFEMTGQGKELHLAPGNHDIRDSQSLAFYLRFFPGPYDSFSRGDTLFILLNTEVPGEEGMIAGEQLVWLETELQRSFRYKFVFLHRPPFPVVPLHGLDRHKEARDRLHRLFVKNGVSLVVSAHDHLYHRSAKDAVTYVITGGGGGYLLSFVKNGDFHHYIVATRTKNGYSFAVKDIEGKVRDEFAVKR